MISALRYFIREGFPGNRAHHIQIARQASAFSAVGMPTSLVVPRLPKESPAEIAAAFGLKRPLDLKPISSGKGLPKLARDLLYKRALVQFVRRPESGTAFYGRSSGKLPMPVVLKERRDTPTFLEVHSGEFEKYMGDADGLIAISRALRDFLVSQGIPSKKILVAHDGVDLDAYSGPRDRKVDRRCVVFTGHLYPDRGGEVLVEAMTRVDACAVFVGGSPDDIERVSALARKLKVDARFVGMKPPSEVPSWQMAADVLVMPYRSNLSTREWCSPLKLFEYMASGAPIVSSDLPSIREVLRHQENGLLVPPDDPVELANAVNRLLSDRGLARELAGRAREEVRQYSWDARARSIIEFMRSR
jgi:glycosyltransferase involved in cell wall biosynthesis